jgi:hypothetical protein
MQIATPKFLAHAPNPRAFALLSGKSILFAETSSQAIVLGDDSISNKLLAREFPLLGKIDLTDRMPNRPGGGVLRAND